jgi:hypothetical protein
LKLLETKRVTFLTGFLVLRIFQELGCPSGAVAGVGDGDGFGTNHPHRRGAAAAVTVVAALRTITCLSAGFGGPLVKDFLCTTMSLQWGPKLVAE